MIVVLSQGPVVVLKDETPAGRATVNTVSS